MLRLYADKLTIAKHEFDEIELMGIIGKADRPWASPLQIVSKPGILKFKIYPHS